MTDRELLELAAKAAGYASWDWAGDYTLNVYDAEGHHYLFAPGIRSDDAFDLMVKLRFRVECTSEGQVYVWRGEQLIWNGYVLHEDDDYEREAVTRLSITCAAAEIGKAMP